MKFKAKKVPNICDGCNESYYGVSYDHATISQFCKQCFRMMDIIRIPKHIPYRQKFKYKLGALRKLNNYEV